MTTLNQCIGQVFTVPVYNVRRFKPLKPRRRMDLLVRVHIRPRPKEPTLHDIVDSGLSPVAARERAKQLGLLGEWD